MSSLFPIPTCKLSIAIILCLVMPGFIHVSRAQSEAKIYCDSLKADILREQTLRLYVLQHPGAANRDSVQTVLDSTAAHNLRKVKARFYADGVPGILQYSYECVRYFWMLVIRAGKDPQFQNDVTAWVEKKGLDKYELREDYAFVVDKRLVLDGKPQKYGTQLKIDTLTRTVSFQPLADTGRLDELRKTVGLLPAAEFIKQQEKILFNKR